MIGGLLAAAPSCPLLNTFFAAAAVTRDSRVAAGTVPPPQGLLIYRLLGSKAEYSFTVDWATGIAVEQASQWRDIAKDLCIEVALLLLLDQLKVTPPLHWCVAARGICYGTPRAKQRHVWRCSAVRPLSLGPLMIRRAAAGAARSHLRRLELQVDFMSVQGSLFAARKTRWTERMAQHIKFYRRIEA